MSNPIIKRFFCRPIGAFPDLTEVRVVFPDTRVKHRYTHTFASEPLAGERVGQDGKNEGKRVRRYTSMGIWVYGYMWV